MEAVRALVICGDAVEALQLLTSESVGLTVTDPPYESIERHRAVGTTTRLKRSKGSSNRWFASFPNERMGSLLTALYQAHRKDSHAYMFTDDETAHVILTGKNPYAPVGSVSENPVSALAAGWRAWPTLTWVKTLQRVPVERGADDCAARMDAMTATGLGWHWRRAEERIIFLEKGKRRLHNLAWRSVQYGEARRRDGAPTCKPARIIERLILNASDEGDWVLDPFMGSGMVLQVALRCGRNAIGIDVDAATCTRVAEGLRRLAPSRVYAMNSTPQGFAIPERNGTDDR